MLERKPGGVCLILSRLATGLVAALILAAAASAQPLARVEGVDDQRLREGLVAALGEADGEAPSRWRARERAQEAADIARRYFRSKGYYAAVVEPRLGEDDQPLIRVVPGARYRFLSVGVTYDTPEREDRTPRGAIAEAISLKAGDPVEARAVIAAEAEGLAALRDGGWPFAEAGEREIVVDHLVRGARGTFRYETGPYTALAEPRLIGGDAELREGFAAILAPWERGAEARRSVLDTYQERLEGLEAVSSARVEVAREADGRLHPVDVIAEAAPKHRVEGALSYSTSEGAGAEARWTRRNLFGGDERLTAGLTAATIDSGAELIFVAPHWRRYAQRFDARAGYFAERTDSFDRDAAELAATLSRPLTRYLTGSVGAEIQRAETSDAAGERGLTTLSAVFGLAYDGRDDVLDPRGGWFAEAETRPSHTFGDEDVRYLRSVAGVRGYLPVADDMVLAGRVRLGSLLGAEAREAPADQRFYAGGGGSVRGYGYQALSPELEDTTLAAATDEFDFFGGASLAEVSAELRWRRSERLGFAAFVDGGAASLDTVPEISDMRYGAGVGVRYYPGFGPLRLDIAAPLDKRPGDDPVHVYISIGQAF